MVFYSIKSTEKVFHLPHCKIRQRMNKEYEQHFDTPEEAREHGYRMCNCCSPVGSRLRKEQVAVNQFCQENGVSCRQEDGQLHIRTPHSKWRIIVNGKAKKLFLYHKNSYEKPERIPSIVPGYHSQAIRCDSIMGYLQYIVEHDTFRVRERKIAKKKKRAYHNLRKNTWKYQKGRGNARVSANQLYSVLDNVYF